MDSQVDIQTSEVPEPAVTAASIATRARLPKAAELAIAFLAIGLVMAWIEFGGKAILDNDGFYHMRWSRTLREQFPHLPRFRALPLTTLDENHYVDHHFLFHIALIPFTFGNDMRLGAKWAAVTFSSLGILSVFALLVVFDLRYRWLWLPLIVASSEPFLYRMSMTRAPALSLGLVALAAYLICKGRHRWLVPLSFAFVWYYDLFVLVLILALLHSLAIYLADGRIEWRSPLAAFAGIVAGLILNPYFPKNLRLLYEHFLMKATTGSGYSVDVGVEWYPYETWTMLSLSALAFVTFFTALAAFEYRRRKDDLKPLFFLFVSLVLLLMAFKSRRFIEYWPPFAVLFAAFTISPRLANYDLSWFSSRRIPAASSSGWFMRRRELYVGAAGAALAVVTVAVSMTINVFQARADMKAESDPYDYKGASQWIAANVPPGEMIFNTDWDDFPMLYYYNPNYTYIVGLDPTYLYDRDPDLWKLYASITLGDEDDPAPAIRDRFGAQWVFTDNQHPDFLDNAAESGKFETVYSDSKTTVLRILSAEEIKAKHEREEPDTTDSDDDDAGAE